MLSELTIKEFMSTLASDQPLPGGGSAAALVGATACSLLSMVASLTIDKKGYEDVQDEMFKIRETMIEASRLFQEEMDKDADSYRKVLATFRLPKETDEEKSQRNAAIQTATLEAAKIPLGVAERAAKLFAVARITIEKGNRNVISDGAVGAMMARSCVLAAVHNIRVNANALKNEVDKTELLRRAEELENFAMAAEADVLQMMP